MKKTSNWHELLLCGCKHLHYQQERNRKSSLSQLTVVMGKYRNSILYNLSPLSLLLLLGPNFFLFLCQKRTSKWARDHAKEWRKSSQPFCQNLKLLNKRAPIQLPRIVSMLFQCERTSLSLHDATFQNNNWISYLRREYLLGLSQLDMDMLFHSCLFFFSLLSVSFVCSSFVSFLLFLSFYFFFLSLIFKRVSDSHGRKKDF